MEKAEIKGHDSVKVKTCEVEKGTKILKRKKTKRLDNLMQRVNARYHQLEILRKLHLTPTYELDSMNYEV